MNLKRFASKILSRLYKRQTKSSNLSLSKREVTSILKSLESGRKGSPHGLPGKLILSLTSYPLRYPVLYSTLLCLMSQSLQPDKIILWIADKDMDALPENVKKLSRYGLEIKSTEDTGPFKKIIPALELFPDAFIATADDDIRYPSNWLEGLIKGWDGNPKQIVCHRAHGIQFDDTGLPKPYRDWDYCVSGEAVSPYIFPTGAGGVLYPPHIFYGDILNKSRFQNLCARADDVWLYWMARLNGAIYKKSSDNRQIDTWEASQDVALWHQNHEGNANDIYIGNMITAYGWPAGTDN